MTLLRVSSRAGTALERSELKACTMRSISRAARLVAFSSEAKSMPSRLSGPTWQCMQRTPRLPAQPRIVPTSSRFEMSFGSTWRFLKVSGIWATASGASSATANASTRRTRR